MHAKIQAVAESLLPPKGVRQAEVLARIGEPLLDLLAERPPHGQRQAAATIRAASLVGGDAALPLIAGCAKTTGWPVREALQRAWLLFDVKEFAQMVLSGSPHARALTITDQSQLPSLPHITGLRSLSVECPEGTIDLTVVRDLPALESLNITGGTGADLTPLSGHQALSNILVLGSGAPVDLGPLPTVPQLHYLYLTADRVTGLEGLRDSAGLQRLGLEYLSNIDQLPTYLPVRPLRNLALSGGTLRTLGPMLGIPQLAELEELDFWGLSALHSIYGVERWAGTLQSLSLVRCEHVLNLEPLVSLPRLEHLQLDPDPAPDLHTVRRLSSLRELMLFGNSTVDLSALEGMPSLTVRVRRGQKVLGAQMLGDGSKVARI